MCPGRNRGDRPTWHRNVRPRCPGPCPLNRPLNRTTAPGRPGAGRRRPRPRRVPRRRRSGGSAALGPAHPAAPSPPAKVRPTCPPWAQRSAPTPGGFGRPAVVAQAAGAGGRDGALGPAAVVAQAAGPQGEEERRAWAQFPPPPDWLTAGGPRPEETAGDPGARRAPGTLRACPGGLGPSPVTGPKPRASRPGSQGRRPTAASPWPGLPSSTSSRRGTPTRCLSGATGPATVTWGRGPGGAARGGR